MLTTRQAAAMAEVAPSTIKRWADDGVLPVTRTPGGHRRFARHDLEKWLRELNTGATEGGPVGEWIATLRAGERHEIEARLLEARARYGSWAVVADTLGQVLVAVGRSWRAGDLTIGEEHLASEALARSLARIGDAMPTATRGRPVVLACVGDDEHTLGLALAELCVREVGLPVVWLGRRTPFAEVIRAVRERHPIVVGLSASSASDDADALGRVADEVGAACRAHGARLVLGGTGAWPSARTFGERPASFAEFHEWLGAALAGTAA